MTDRPFIVGVDGGGSGCRAAIADFDGGIIGKGSAGPANATTDFDEAVQNVRSAMSMALTDAGLSEDDAKAALAHVGLAGIMSQADADRFVAQLPFARATVTDDRPTSHAGALSGKDGLLAAIGTGSFVGARTEGTLRFLGGWGLQLGDHASGAWLGRALLEQVLLAEDGLRERSPLTDSVLEDFHADPNAIVAFARSAAPADYAALAPSVFEAADAGDPLGVELVQRGTAYLETAFAHLDPGPETPICLTGGLGPLYRHWIAKAYAARLVKPAGTALDGALLLARRQPGTAS